MKTSVTNMKKSCGNLFAAITALAVLAWGIGCGQSREEQATAPPPAQQEAEKVRPRKLESARVTENTRQTYQWYCAQCHGAEGKGDGVNAKFLTVPPRDHTKVAYLETRTDAQLFDAIKFGGLAVGRAPCMPAWGHTLDDDAIRSLVQYIRELCQCEAL